MGILPISVPATSSSLIPAETKQQTLELGHYYLLQGQIRPHHSYATPGAFDAEKWALQQNVMAGFRIKSIQELQPQQLYTLGYAKHFRQQQYLNQRYCLCDEQQRLAIGDCVDRQHDQL